MQGLREKPTRLRIRRARYFHAPTLAPGEGEGLSCDATLGHISPRCAGGGSTAFSGDRAPARRKAVEALEAPDPWAGGASAPLPKHHHSFASWQSVAVVCARVVDQLHRRRTARTAFATPPGGFSEANAGGVDARHQEPWPGR
jgi:hypothetical protein